MKRRDVSRRLFGTCTPGALGAAQAQASGPIEGTHHVRLGQPVATATPGKIEVIEFLWCGCPDCQALELTLNAWVKALPADVAFRRVPVAFGKEPFVAHQRIFYALESTGQLSAMHAKVFAGIHNERQRLDKPADIPAFVAKNGVDAAQFGTAYDSFSVQTKASQATQLAAAYKIYGVPAFGVNGRYYTSNSLAGSNQNALAVVDFLVGRLRKTA